MTFLIRTIDTTAAGREIVRDRTIAKARLSVGRAAENDIHLPDLAVEQRHISIARSSNGLVQVEALGTLGFGLDGRVSTSATIDPQTGAEIELGSSHLTVAKDAKGAVTITIKQAEAKGAKVDTVRGFQLASALPSKRLMAWVLSLAILVLLLSVPVFTHLTRDRQQSGPDTAKVDQVVLDSAWSSGPLSLAHHDLKDSCESCHVQPFVSVQDETCLTCHEELGDHAAKPRLAKGMSIPSTFDAMQWSIGQKLGKEGPGSCTSCHLEHEGKVRQQAATQEFCADCHTALDARLTDVAFGNASDFGKKHPQFRPTFYTAFGQKEPVRVSMANAPVEKSGLVFPHDIHMNAQGGVARMAISLPDYGSPLGCASCHEPTKDKIGFKPVEMESSCESCHSLVSGRGAGGGFTSLRHGNVDDLMEDLARIDRKPARRTIIAGRSRPGQFASGGTYAVSFGRPASSLISINRALLPGGVCGDCHIPTRKGGRPDLIPVNLPDRFLKHGFFSHKAHRTEKCVDCHEATTSKSATDLLLPDLESCQDCHIGEVLPRPGFKVVVKKDQVPSTCAMCHGYHTPTKPWPGDHPILQSTPEGKRVREADSVASLSALLKKQEAKGRGP